MDCGNRSRRAGVGSADAIQRSKVHAGALFQPLLQRLTFEVLHDEVGEPAAAADEWQEDRGRLSIELAAAAERRVVRLTTMRANHRPKQVHEEHGAAMYEAQLLEQYLGHAVLAASDMTGMSFKNLERIVRKSSIAQLMRQLDTVVAVPPRFRARLEAARIVRNQLAHNYFATRSEFFQTAEGRAVMIHELDNVGEEFYQLWGVLDSAVIAWLARDQPRAVEFGEDLASYRRSLTSKKEAFSCSRPRCDESR